MFFSSMNFNASALAVSEGIIAKNASVMPICEIVSIESSEIRRRLFSASMATSPSSTPSISPRHSIPT